MVRARAKSVTWIAPHGYRKVRRDVSRADPVPETALQQRRAARDRALQEPLNLSIGGEIVRDVDVNNGFVHAISRLYSVKLQFSNAHVLHAS